MVSQEKEIRRYNFAITLSVVCAVGVILAFFFIIKPLYDKSSESGSEAKIKQTRYNNLLTKKDNLSQMKDKEVELKKDADTVKDALPSSKDVGRLFIQMNDLAKLSGGVIQSVSETNSDYGSSSSAAGSGFSGIQSYSYGMPLTMPSYANFKSFISSSESALRLLDITSMDINAGDDGKLNATLTINTYARN